MPRFFTRRRALIGAISLVSIFILTALLTVFIVRWGYLDRWLAARLRTTLAEYGVRLEIGSLRTSPRRLEVELRGLKFYPQDSAEPFAALDRLTATVTVHDLLGFGRQREVRLRSMIVDGLRAWYAIDANGRANLAGLRRPPRQKEEQVLFTYSAANIEVRNAEVYYVDRPHRLDGAARHLNLTLSPAAGDDLRLVASAEQSGFTFDGRESSDLGFDLKARVNADGAELDSLTVRSPLMTADLKGKLEDWRGFNYQLNARAEVKLREAVRLFAPHTKLNGAAHFEGRVEGSGVEYRAHGKVRSDNLTAQDVRVEGLNLATLIAGKEEEYEARGELIINSLAAAGFHVNRFVAAGRMIGGGEDFSWAGNFRISDLIGQDLQATGIDFSEARVKGRWTDLTGLRVAGRAHIETLVTAEVPIGNLAGEVTATRDEINIPDFNGELFGGVAKGSARVRVDGRGASTVLAELGGLNLDQAAAVAAGKRVPLRGTADGRVNLTWQHDDYRSAEGAVNLTFKGTTLRPDEALGPAGAATPGDAGAQVSGELNVIASGRRLRVENTAVHAGATRVAISGELGWDRQGTLDVAIDSGDAAELQSLALDFAQAADTAATRDLIRKIKQEHEVQLTDKLSFRGRVTGSVDDPRVEGRLNLDAINLHDELLGSLAGELAYHESTLRLDQARLTQPEGGRAEFALQHALDHEGGTAVRGRLEKFGLGSVVRIFVAYPLAGEVTGELDLTGLPEAMHGTAVLRVANAKYGERAFEEASGHLVLNGTRAEVENLRLRSGAGLMTGAVAFDTKTKGYRLKLRGEGLDVGEFVNAARETHIPLTGHAGIQVEAESSEFKLEETRGHIFDRLEATVTSDDLRYRGTQLGQVQLTAGGHSSVASLNLKAELLGHSYVGGGEIDFSQPDAPVRATVELKDVALAPVLDLLAGEPLAATGAASGQLRIAGNLLGEHDAARVEADFTQLAFEVGDYRLTAQPPVRLRVSGRQLDLGTVKLSGTNTNLTLEGSVALGEGGRMGFSASGDVNLRLLQTFVPNLFADGLVRIQASAGGTYQQPRFSGTATLEDGVLRSPDLPLALSRAKGRLLFTADQAQIESFTADLGSGRMSLVGGAAFVGLKPERWRFQIRANDVRMDYPRDARTTFDGDLLLEGRRQFQLLSGLVNVRRAEYLADVDLFEFVQRMTDEFGTAPIAAAGENKLLPPTQLDIRVVANDSLVLRTKTLDVVGNATLRLRGPADDPSVSGRITVSRGIIDQLFNERYRIANGFIEFAGIDKRPPRLSVEAEAEVLGYRLIVLVSGVFDALRVTPRSEPPLPQADVVALMTTGRLANEGFHTSSSQALAQTSVNTIASFFAQPISRRIESNVTSRLFGLNRFSIDPLLTGRGTDPTARITVGRRVTKDLAITYSTNLASNQDQVILVEYRASDRLSFVASRAQDGTFGFDVRLRKRF